MTDWWSKIEQALDRLGDDAPDPWADADTGADAVTLTAEQVAFLEQVGTASEMFVDDGDWDAE